MTESTKTNVDTRALLIEAAAGLFAERGFDTVSLRDITGLAGVNVASVKYHFGSRDGLMDAVVTDYVTPVNVERLRRIADLKTQKSVTVEELLRAFFEPLLGQLQDSPMSEQLFGKLVGRMLGERSYEFPDPVMKQFREVAVNYVPAFCQAVSGGLSEEEVFWRIHFSFGVMAHTLTHCELLQNIAEGQVRREELGQTFERALRFCVSGFEQEQSK